MTTSDYDNKEHDSVILMVDDNPTNLSVLFNSLSDSGFKLLVAQDGESALQQVELVKPDIILLDIMMPGLNGFDVCERLKNRDETRDIPIIFMTSLSDTTNKLKGFAVGAVDYLTKPLQSEEVIARVRTHLAIRKMHIDLELKNRQIVAQKNTLTRTNQTLEKALKTITETQDQLVRAQKMASISQMIAGIAHEINNPLGVVMGTIGFIKQGIQHRDTLIKELKTSADERAKVDSQSDPLLLQLDYIQKDTYDLLEILHKSSDRIKKIVDSLIAHTRFAQEDIRPLDLAVELDYVISMLRSKWKKDVDVVKAIGADNVIECHPIQINQVLMQVLTNAYQSLDEPGQITICTELIRDELHITIRDTGRGMDEETVSRIFDPFFTTQEIGEGLGLGLYLCYGIIENHGGQIDVKSSPGCGTETIIVLPKYHREPDLDDRMPTLPFPDLTYYARKR